MDSLSQRIHALSSAEDFLAFFGLPYDETVVRVNRLHILKRFNQYRQQSLAQATAPAETALDEVAQFRHQRQLLQQAYQDFVRSTPAQEKVFKVFQDAGGTQHVGLASLRHSLPRHRVPGATGPAA